MNYGVYALRDIYYGFLTPTFQENDAVALRGFLQAIDSPDVSHSIIAYKPEHFSLFRLGEFNSREGKFKLLDVPELLCDGSAYARRSSDA